MKLFYRGLIPLALALLTAAMPSVAAQFTLNSTVDAGDSTPGDGRCASDAGACTLRAAIQETNKLLGRDTVIVPAGTYVLTIAGTGEDRAGTGDLDITDDLTIEGAGALKTTIDGNFIDRVFHIVSATSVVIRDVSIRNGSATGSSSKLCGEGDGGGIMMGDGAGALSLIHVVLAGNRGSQHGGGLFNCRGTLVVVGSTVSGNVAVQGAGIDNNRGLLSLINSTVTQNRSTVGTAGISFGRGMIANATVLNNIGSNLHVADPTEDQREGVDFPSDLTVRNSIIGDCIGTLMSQGYNVFATDTSRCNVSGDTTGNRVGDPLVGALQDNGGQVLTHALLPGSPAIDAGNPAQPGSGGAACEVDDERSFPRDGSRCDAGAYETAGRCDGRPEGAPCEGGNACTTGGNCQGGQCVGGMPTNCNDEDECTDDRCDLDFGCRHFQRPNCFPSCGNGVLNSELGENCDEGPANGAPGSCCRTGCTLRPTGEVCRVQAGICDVAETCDGNKGSCPADDVAAAGQVCRAQRDICDVQEVCDGHRSDCPPDVVAPDGTRCADGDICTPEDVCIAGECSGDRVCSVDVAFNDGSIVATLKNGQRVRIKVKDPAFLVTCRSLDDRSGRPRACQAQGVCLDQAQGGCSKPIDPAGDPGICRSGRPILRAKKVPLDQNGTAKINLPFNELGKKLVKRLLKMGESVFITVCVTVPSSTSSTGSLTVPIQAEIVSPCPGSPRSNVCGIVTKSAAGDHR